MELVELKKSLEKYEWFHDIAIDNFKRIVVYAKYINVNVLTSVPDTFQGTHVLVHFASSKDLVREKFVEKIQTYKVQEPEELNPEDIPSILKGFADQCGTETVKEIFMEVHDGDDAVTHFSSVFPVCFRAVSKLYDTYGFDVLAEELGIN